MNKNELDTAEQQEQYRLVKDWGRSFNLSQRAKIVLLRHHYKKMKNYKTAQEILEDC